MWERIDGNWRAPSNWAAGAHPASAIAVVVACAAVVVHSCPGAEHTRPLALYYPKASTATRRRLACNFVTGWRCGWQDSGPACGYEVR